MLHKLYGFPRAKSSAIARASAIKDGLVATLHSGQTGYGEDVALGSFARNVREWGLDGSAPEVRSDEDAILSSLECIVKEIQRRELFARPVAFNIAKHVWVADVHVPLLSVVDIVFETMQLRIKSTMRCPSTIQPRDLAALRIDALVRPQPAEIIYVTPKKFNWLAPAQVEFGRVLGELTADARALQTFLMTAQDRVHALAMLPLNQGSFYWDDGLRLEAEKLLSTFKERTYGLIRPEGRRVSERTSGEPCGDLLPGAGSGDTEGDLEW